MAFLPCQRFQTIRAQPGKSTQGAIYCDKHSSYGQLLSMAGLSTLHNRRLQDIAILVFKVKNNMCPTYISTLFEQPAIKYELRNHDFTIPRFNTVSFGKHSLRFMGPKVWSSVPSNVKKASTLSSFNANITSEKWILACYQMTITALFALLNLLFLIFYKIMDTFVHIVYSSLKFLTYLYRTQFFLILINLLIDLFFFNLFQCPNLVVIHCYYSFYTLIKVSSSSSIVSCIWES